MPDYPFDLSVYGVYSAQEALHMARLAANGVHHRPLGLVVPEDSHALMGHSKLWCARMEAMQPASVASLLALLNED
ncbi:hypothetical protein ACRALDRAFT_206726 [Sodiomyces alcalophilus JCM 7366]|uniref:uncharacterized protein n=1 Tax=Sodiomyces alcalophilus JCM 7366 TaxID=591952 RepID=UPI0039B5D1B9